jgi:hypothetical protein
MNAKYTNIFKSASILLIPLLLFTLLFWDMPAFAKTIDTISPKQAAELVLKEKSK